MELKQLMKEMEEVEREIFIFLKRLSKTEEKRASVLHISREIGRSYQACLKYVGILQAKGLIKVEDYGNNKQVSVKE